MSAKRKRKLQAIWGAFRRDEDGLALTEYLILLGLISGGVIVAVLSVGNNLQQAWQGWSDWFDRNISVLSAPGPIDSGSDTPVTLGTEESEPVISGGTGDEQSDQVTASEGSEDDEPPSRDDEQDDADSSGGDGKPEKDKPGRGPK